MERDAGSANGQAHDRAAGRGESPEPQEENLSQELAQLLAASIAKSTGAGKPPGGMPTGAELASLASLVSAAASKRGLSPTFKDGLSALSYSHPPQNPATVPDLHDDEPMPIPSTWRQPHVRDDDRSFRQQLGAAAFGLIAGLMVVVPAVLWLSGRLGGPQKQATASASPVITASIEAKPPEVRTVKVQVRPVEPAAERAQDRVPEPASPFVAAAAIEQRPIIEPQRPAGAAKATAALETKPAEPPGPRLEDVLTQASRRIQSGDVMSARETLAAAEDSGEGEILFALAETYDPNMLAAWATRGVAADALKARALYTKALSLGITRAQTRLDALR